MSTKTRSGSLLTAAALVAASPALAQKDESPDGQVNLGGRVFVRDTIARAHIDGAQLTNDLSLESVRANIDFRDFGWLRTSIEVSLEEGGEIDLEDVFIEADLGDLELIAGRFKRPMSPIALESAWQLPAVERGILSEDVEIPGYRVPLGLGGRADGVMASYDFDLEIDPEIAVGVFSAELPRPDGGFADPADLGDNLLRDVYARASVEPIKDLVVGTSGALVTRVGDASSLETRLVGSLDLTVERAWFRGWLEGFAARRAFFDGTSSTGTLLAGRLLVAARLTEPLRGYLRGIEPYGIASALDLSRGGGDHVLELGGGVNALIREHLRLTVEYVRSLHGADYPLPTFTRIDTSTIRIQLGSQFR